MTTNNKKSRGNDGSITDVLKSEIRFRIFSLFNLYPELSLTELMEIMNRSKSTIHHHLEKLIKAGLIDVSREEKVRGNILKKYFSLKPEYKKIVENFEFNLEETSNDRFELYGTYLYKAIRILKFYKKFFEKLRKEKKLYEQLKEFMQEEDGFSSMFYFSKEQFKKVVLLYKEYVDKLNKIDLEFKGIQVERPYFVFTFGMPLKQVIEEIEKPPEPPIPPPAPRPPKSPKLPPRKNQRHK